MDIMNNSSLPDLNKKGKERMLEPNFSTCDVDCAKDTCLEHKKEMPFEVVLACSRDRCECKFDLD